MTDLEKENQELKEQLTALQTLVKQYHGIYIPFICGTVGEKQVDGLYEYILVCPMYGLDGFAVYKKHKDYSAPGW